MSRKSVLIIDDEYAILELIGILLTDYGYQVHTATSGEEGLAMMAQERPDLVVLDFMMPVVNGADVLHRMREQPVLADVPVIMVSAAPRSVEEAYLTFDAFLGKPFDVTELLRKIENLIGKP